MKKFSFLKLVEVEISEMPLVYCVTYDKNVPSKNISPVDNEAIKSSVISPIKVFLSINFIEIKMKAVRYAGLKSK